MDMRVARLIANIKQLELQKATGINQSRISAIENGHVKPSANEKSRLEKALNLNGAIDWGTDLRFKRTK